MRNSGSVPTMTKRIAPTLVVTTKSILVMFATALILPVYAQQGGDAYPYSTIAFFNTPSCPPGWGVLNAAAGYFIIPVPEQSTLGQTVGNPLSSGQDVQHTHTFSSSITLDTYHYAGIREKNNHNVTSAGLKTFTGTSDSSSTNVPYVQLLVCMKNENQGSGTVPSGTLSFFGAKYCPTGWTQPGNTGYFLVGLPANGTPGATFGGSPLALLENRTHTHSISGNVTTDSGAVALAKGHYGKDYGKNGTYPYSGTSDASAANLPYIQFLQCQKQ